MKYSLNSLGLLLCFGLLTNCDPAYEYFIEAKRGDVTVEIHPSLESIYCPHLKDVCAFAKAHRIDEGIYRIARGEKLSIDGGVGIQAPVTSFPFDFVRVIEGNDTLLLKGKDQILKKFVRDKPTNKYYLDL
jgi:hypothetical protein